MNLIDKIINLLKELKMSHVIEPNEDVIDLWVSQDFFILEEIFPPEVLKARGEKALQLYSEKALRTLIELRELFNSPMTINNWKWKGQFKYRGFRPWSYYKSNSYSQHLLGNAFDFDVKEYTADEAREKIKQWKSQGKLKYLTGLEEKVNWVHVDCRISKTLNKNGLYLFNP